MWVKQYNKNFNNKTQGWWDSVLKSYKAVPDSELLEMDEMLMLDKGQAVLHQEPCMKLL